MMQSTVRLDAQRVMENALVASLRVILDVAVTGYASDKKYSLFLFRFVTCLSILHHF